MSGSERKLEIARHDANHEIRLAIEQDFGAQDLRIAMEAALPGPVTQDHHRLALVIFLLRVDASQQRSYAQRGKDSSSHARGIYLRRVSVAGKLEAGELITAEAGKGMRVPRVGANVRHRYPCLAVAAHIGSLETIRQHHQPVRVGERQGPQQHTLDDGEDRGCRANSEGEHQHRRSGKTRRLAQLAEGKLQVEQERRHRILTKYNYGK